MATATAVEVAGLGRAYGERVVLRDVSFTLPEGATLAVFGANGAGKSTLLRILAGLLKPHAGAAHVLGAALPREAWKVRGRIGLLAHEPLLYRDLSVRENLRFHARLHGVAFERAAELVDRVGLGGRDEDPVRTLSRGMTQRAAICRAVLHEPDLLLLDEPSLGLAPNLVDLIFQTILEISRGGTSILLVEQNASMALEIAARGYVLETGRVTLAGPAAELKARQDFVEAYLG